LIASRYLNRQKWRSSNIANCLGYPKGFSDVRIDQEK
jgi:hypothetical protein